MTHSYLLKVNNTSSNIVSPSSGVFMLPLPYNLANIGPCYISVVEGTMGFDTQPPFTTYMELGVKSNLPCEGMSLVENVAGSGTSYSYLFNVNLTVAQQTVGSSFHSFPMTHTPYKFFCSGLPDRIIFNRYLSIHGSAEGDVTSSSGYIGFTLLIEFEDMPTKVLNKLAMNKR